MSLYAARLTLANAFTAPIGGQTISAVGPLQITWTPSTSPPVKLRLMYGNDQQMALITGSKHC